MKTIIFQKKEDGDILSVLREFIEGEAEVAETLTEFVGRMIKGGVDTIIVTSSVDKEFDAARKIKNEWPDIKVVLLVGPRPVVPISLN